MQRIPTFLSLVFLATVLHSQEQQIPTLVEHAANAAVNIDAFGGAHIAVSKHFPIPVLEVGSMNGRGVCLDQPCRFIATNYHVVDLQKGLLHVEGAAVDSILRLTGPNDVCASNVSAYGRHLRYCLENDVAIIRLRNPLPSQFRPVPIAKGNPHVGQKAFLIVRQGRKTKIVEGRVLASDMALDRVTMKDGDEQAFGHAIIASMPFHPGESGSPLCDEDGDLLGLATLYGEILVSGKKVPVLVATPVSTLYRLINSNNPTLARNIFPGYSLPPELSKEEMAQQSGETDEALFSSALSLALVDSSKPRAEALIGTLKDNARNTLKRMVDIAATQCSVQNGRKEPCYEVAVWGNEQIFRRLGADQRPGKASTEFPVPNYVDAIWAGSAWHDDLQKVVDEPIHYIGTATYDRNDNDAGVPVYLFRQQTSASEGTCDFEEHVYAIPLFGSFHGVVDWSGPADCTAEVVADRNLDVIAIIKDIYPPADRLTAVERQIITYEPIKLGRPEPVLVPTAITLQALFRRRRHAKVEATIEFSHYHELYVVSKIVF